MARRYDPQVKERAIRRSRPMVGRERLKGAVTW